VIVVRLSFATHALDLLQPDRDTIQVDLLSRDTAPAKRALCISFVLTCWFRIDLVP